MWKDSKEYLNWQYLNCVFFPLWTYLIQYQAGHTKVQENLWSKPSYRGISFNQNIIWEFSNSAWNDMTNTGHIISCIIYVGQEVPAATASTQWGFAARLVLLCFFTDENFWLFMMLKARSTNLNFALGTEKQNSLMFFSPWKLGKGEREKANPVSQHNLQEKNSLYYRKDSPSLWKIHLCSTVAQTTVFTSDM